MEKYTQEEKDVFIAEAKRHVQAMNKSLLRLERFPEKKDALHGIFHACHTLKSISSMMAYEKMAGLCHAIEDVLTKIKNKKAKIKGCSDDLFKCFDALSLSLKAISGNKAELDTAELVEKLHILANSKLQTPNSKLQTPNSELRMEKIASIVTS